MARRFNPYGTLRTEPDMREEFFNTMDGAFPEIAKKQNLVLRKMRSDNSGSLIKCSCVDILTGEPDKDTWCFSCAGEGYLWDESVHDGYHVVLGSNIGQASREVLISPGNTNVAQVSFYFRYNFPLNVFPAACSVPHHQFPDKIVEVALDADGSISEPYQRLKIYSIGNAIDFRSDIGKLEYYRLDCYEEKVKFLNGPRG